MNTERTELDERRFEWLVDHPERIRLIVPPGHKIGAPMPIFKERTQEDMERWKGQFGGTKGGAK